MSNSFLSQDEIDSLLKGSPSPENKIDFEKGNSNEEVITDIDKDLLGEIGNISMGSASTALSQLINQSVNITTPVVSVTSLKELRKEFHVPNIVLEVKYTSGIIGKNMLIIKLPDAAVIASLMMGGDGNPMTDQLSEIEISAVQESMNQMIGSAATSMATMLKREVNISPPISKTWEKDTEPLTEEISETDPLIKVSFKMTIGNLVDSNIMQILPVSTAKRIVSIMMGEEEETKKIEQSEQKKPMQNNVQNNMSQSTSVNNTTVMQETTRRPQMEERYSTPVEVHEAAFDNLVPGNLGEGQRNIDLILDVPLEISVVLGRSKKSIKDVLSLANGSLIELNTLADEPVEILVNGKKIAYGEVVVVDENFGVRITNIVSGDERVKSLRD